VDQAYAVPERLEAEPRRFQGLGVAIDADKLCRRSGLEKPDGMPAVTERRIDDDSPAFQCRTEDVDNGSGKDRVVTHVSPFIATDRGPSLRRRPFREGRQPTSR